ncbi:MAG: VWA domain-containing protein [Bacteroidaceae bacterium]|nr:VWA domain-containing protein [Bacteroidaceae bacterium]
MKKRIFNLIIIDESGSMMGIKKAAIDSVNETIQTIRSAQKNHEEQEHYVTLVTFNDCIRTVYDCVPVNEVKELTDSSYHPDCSTALYDAMGFSMNALRPKVAEEDNVLVTIVTDGYENASKEFNRLSINVLVNELKGKGWIFAYIGANHDVESVATSLSIKNTLRFRTDDEGTKIMSSKVCESRLRLFNNISSANFCCDDANENFFEDSDNI